MRRFHYIDALRGYAILGVLIVHCGAQVDGMESATAWGARGVQLFFIVSALTLMGSWSSSNDGSAAFYLRRLFRIAPMFWLALIFYVPNYTAWWKIAMTATFTHGLHPETIYTGIVPGGWTIADEALFYLVFPILAATITSWQRAGWLLAVSLIVSLLTSHYVRIVLDSITTIDQDSARTFLGLSLPVQFPAFATGIFVFHLLATIPRPEQRWPAQALLVGSVFVFIAQAAVSRGGYVLVQASDLILGAVVVSLALGAGQWLVNGPIRHLGKISYSVYLIHFAILAPVTSAASLITEQPAFKFLVILVATMILSAVAASVTYRLIESNGIRLGHALARRIGSVRTPAAVGPSVPSRFI